MGTMTLPASGVLCIDANIVIYTVEKHPPVQLRSQAIMVVCRSWAGLHCRQRTCLARNSGRALSRWSQAVSERL